MKSFTQKLVPQLLMTTSSSSGSYSIPASAKKVWIIAQFFNDSGGNCYNNFSVSGGSLTTVARQVLTLVGCSVYTWTDVPSGATVSWNCHWAGDIHMFKER